MFKKILYPTDFSDVSLKAIDFIKQLKECGSMEVIILHVINQRSVDAVQIYGGGSVDFIQWERAIREMAKNSLMEIEKELKGAGLEVRSRIEIGIPLREILKVEKEEDVSLIIIGSHGKTNLEEVFLGSVSEKVIRKCRNPVLVIKRT